MNLLKELIEIASAEVGVKETGQNLVKYNDWYWGSAYRSDGASYPWCVVFCAWICDQAKIPFPHVAHCNQVESYAKSHNQWIVRDYKVGDFIIFDYNGDGNRDHIGLVVGVSGSELTTIEGNYSDKVAIVKRNGTSIVGAYRPEYTDALVTDIAVGDNSSPIDSKDTEDTPRKMCELALPLLKEGDEGTEVAAVQSILKCVYKQHMPNSFNRYGVADGIWGAETTKCLLSVTGKPHVDSITWVLLIGGVR